MKVLVTGANGFLGLSVVHRLLLDTNYEVVCFVRSDRNSVKLHSLKDNYPGRVSVYRGSLLDRDDCKACLDSVSRVYHLAAAVGGPPAEMFLNSSVATDHLLSAVVNTGRNIEMVFCSSFSVYETANLSVDEQVDESTLIESSPVKRDIYSLTKLHQERIVRKYYEEHGLPVVVLRPGVIYGPGSSAISSRVGLSVFGRFWFVGGKNILPLTYVENCAKAFIDVSVKSDYKYDIYNIVDDGEIRCDYFLSKYINSVGPIKYYKVNKYIMMAICYICEKYYDYSKGQLPDIFTIYKFKSLWIGRKYCNNKLKSLGWRQIVGTEDALNMHFNYLVRK